MKNLLQISILTILSLIFSSHNSAFAQEDVTQSKGELEFGLGLNFLGPSQGMYDHMEKEWLNGYTYEVYRRSGFWLLIWWVYPHSDTVYDRNYPRYSKTTKFSYQFGYSHHIFKNSRVGALMNYSTFKSVYGGTPNGGSLKIKFSSVSMVPYFENHISNTLSVLTGPALFINYGKKFKSNDKFIETYSTITPGFLIGSKLKLWDTGVTNGKLNVSYFFSAKSKIGPYTSDFDDTLPRTSVRNSYLSVGFILGLYLVSPKKHNEALYYYKN